jgi:hypothetical protein
MVQELLNAGVIHPSMSPYSSPVVMVLKKEGSWRMCPDFRALKKLTIMLTGEIDRPSTGRVEPVRGCLITQAVWDEPP